MKHEQVDIEKVRAAFGRIVASPELDVLQDLCESLLDELAALRERGRWRPIESAPKDGTRVLVSWRLDCPGEAPINFARYDNHEGMWADACATDRIDVFYPQPTLFQPLPEAPR